MTRFFARNTLALFHLLRLAPLLIYADVDVSCRCAVSDEPGTSFRMRQDQECELI
jgi:hypothetical protein